jgi:predicted SAM-dependent methyltransferase
MKLHLGCGFNYIEGWCNVDLDSSVADLHADLRNPLPCADATVDLIYNEHFLEHLTRNQGLAFLKECRRVLNSRGVLRISTPDARWLLAQYLVGKLDEWTDVGWVPETSCRLLNEGMRSWGHEFLYDLPELIGTLKEAGFSEIHRVPYRASANPELGGLECRPWHQELIVEAQ